MSALNDTTRWLMTARPQLAALALVLALNMVIAPGFLDLTWSDGRLYGSLVNLLNRAAPVALLALGMSMVIATRGIDLSVGAVMAIAGAVAAVLVNGGAPWPVAVAAALGAGLACGLWNGVLVAVIGIQPIVATLILMVAGRGIAQLITDGRILTFNDPGLAAIGGGAWLGLPIPVWITLAAALLLIVLTRRTALGLFIEAIGVNPAASRLSGVNSRMVLICVYVASGLMAALAGLIVAGDIRGADANNAGLWLELDAILAAVIGGASLYGGRLGLSLALLGVWTLQGLKLAILRSGLPAEYNLIVMALLIAVVLALQSPAGGRAWRRLTPSRRETAP